MAALKLAECSDHCYQISLNTEQMGVESYVRTYRGEAPEHLKFSRAV